MCVVACAHWSADRSLHPETDEYFPLVCWLLNRLLGKCLSSTSLARSRFSMCFSRVLREEYFTLHGTWDTLNYDLFITQRSRRCGWEVSASQLFLIDAYLESVRSLLLQLSMRLWSHCHRYVSSPTLTDHGVLCFFHESCMMLSLTDDTVDTLHLHLIWTCSFPQCSPVLTQTKPRRIMHM